MLLVSFCKGALHADLSLYIMDLMNSAFSFCDCKCIQSLWFTCMCGTEDGQSEGGPLSCATSSPPPIGRQCVWWWWWWGGGEREREGEHMMSRINLVEVKFDSFGFHQHIIEWI